MRKTASSVIPSQAVTRRRNGTKLIFSSPKSSAMRIISMNSNRSSWVQDRYRSLFKIPSRMYRLGTPATSPFGPHPVDT